MTNTPEIKYILSQFYIYVYFQLNPPFSFNIILFLSTYPSIYLSIHLSIYKSIYLSININLSIVWLGEGIRNFNFEFEYLMSSDVLKVAGTVYAVYMYVCMYVCTYVCMYICMYVCMYVFMYVWMYVCMYVCMYICIYVCIYVFNVDFIVHYFISESNEFKKKSFCLSCFNNCK